MPAILLVLGATPAVAVLAQLYTGGRRRRRFNRSLHELRRPLQAMALGGDVREVPGGGGFLDLALAALSDLDRLVNGAPRGDSPRRDVVSARELVVAAIGRWRSADPEADIALFWDAGAAPLEADAAAVAQALDNLFGNWREHGGPRLVVTGAVVAGKVRITLADSGRGERRDRTPVASNGARQRNPRRGHGLEIVGAVARSHGGRFAISRSAQGAVAALELPLAPGVAHAA